MLKGLILKDLYSIRFNLIMAFLITLLPNLVLILMGGGMFVGSSELSLISLIPYGMLNFIQIAVFSSFVLNTLDYDSQCGWTKLSRCMPVSGKTLIGAKLASTYITIGMLVLVSLFFNVMGIIVFGMNTEVMLTMPICIGFLQVITLSPTFVLSSRIGIKYASMIYYTLLAEIGFGAFSILMAGMVGDITAAVLRIIFYIALPILAVATAIITYNVGKKQNEEDI